MRYAKSTMRTRPANAAPTMMGISMSSLSSWHSSAGRHKKETQISNCCSPIYIIIFLFIQPEFTSSKLLSSDTEGLHVHLEGVNGEIWGHAESLPLTAHVREPQGAFQVVQTVVLGHKGLWNRG